MPFEIIRNDIARVRADAIVNSANPKPVCGSGTDTAIYLAAGEKDLLEARQQIGEIARGDAAATPAFALPAKIIIHTVGPIWQGGMQGELEVLASCYRKSLAIAEENGCESIAFPLISTGNYGFPKDEALRIALQEISAFLENHEMLVKLVVFDRKAYELSQGLADDVRQYIDERYVESARETEYAMGRREQEYARREQEYARWEEYQKDASAYRPAPGDAAMPPNAPFEAPQAHYSNAAPPPPAAKKKPSFFSLGWTTKKEKKEELPVLEVGETFQERLFALIDERKLTDAEVYKRANLDRKLFSKIRCNPAYKPGKRTAVALAIALKLNLDQTVDLLGRAEMALSPSSKFDLIVEYCIEHEIYDIFEINALLFAYDQPLLGL